ncbi:TolC family outer membrane protein [Sphingomonas nostoxanthinifaciens]|uniref:TolC family outer membrane protein n=1 Tax=Sphingomonas nostoxanthinifaciens TaxID=2872652 RepID=UPI001CC21032|nr:TolC family outer membrane protein [Sphingomonas nostoxanthinifaciens]UAK23629.1 TolC family outer membrane protein [Sphingomonas nostoxanthinifaciens]
MRYLLTGAALIAAPADATTLRDAFVQAYGTNPTLTAARAQQQAVDEYVPIAKAQSRVQVTGTVGVTQSTNGITTLTNGGRVFTGGVNLSYPLFQGGRVKNAINAAEARVVSGRADLQTVEGNTFTQTVQAYMDVIRDQSIVQLNVKQVRVLETNLQASRDRFQVGDLTRTDVAQSEARLSLARSTLATAQGNLTASRETYRRIVGSWPDKLDPPPPLPKLPASSDAAVEIGLQKSPSIQSAAALTKASGYDVRTQRAARMPIFSAVGGTSYNNYLGTRAQASGFSPSQNNQFDQVASANSVGVQLSIPLYQGGLVGARVRQAQATQSQAIEQQVDVERQMIANVRAAFAVFKAAGESIVGNQQAVSANTLALEGVRAENSVGNRTVIEVLNAEQELVNAQVQLVIAQHDQYVAGFALLNAMGEAQARDLGLDGGTLYDPVVNYQQERNRLSEWSERPDYSAKATSTRGPTPDDADVQPLVPEATTGRIPVTPPPR